MRRRKVAIVSDVMMSLGGAEMVVMELLKIFPKADFYTLFICPKARKKIEDAYPKVRIKTSVFQWLIWGDIISKYISIIKIFSWIYWEFLNLNDYDLIISSSHSYMAKNVKKKSGVKHLSYVHTPPRYLYDEFSEIVWIKKIPGKWLFWPIASLLKYVDKRGSIRPDVMIANSKNVADRIKKYYGREAQIIYPPVKVDFSKKNIKRGDYFVCLSRLVLQKGIDLAVKVCTENKIPLIVIGNGDELGNLKKMAGPGIKFMEKCDDNKKFEILSEARALIYTSKEEDFGIVPVEALKLGTPVIAYNSGGVRETVLHKKNGVLFENFNEDSLMKAIKLYKTLEINKNFCIESVKKYSAKNFERQIKDLI